MKPDSVRLLAVLAVMSIVCTGFAYCLSDESTGYGAVNILTFGSPDAPLTSFSSEDVEYDPDGRTIVDVYLQTGSYVEIRPVSYLGGFKGDVSSSGLEYTFPGEAGSSISGNILTGTFVIDCFDGSGTVVISYNLHSLEGLPLEYTSPDSIIAVSGSTLDYTASANIDGTAFVFSDTEWMVSPTTEGGGGGGGGFTWNDAGCESEGRADVHGHCDIPGRAGADRFSHGDDMAGAGLHVVAVPGGGLL